MNYNNYDYMENSDEASGHAVVKNFFTWLKMEVWFEIFFRKLNVALVNYAVSFMHWWSVASHAHLR